MLYLYYIINPYNRPMTIRTLNSSSLQIRKPRLSLPKLASVLWSDSTRLHLINIIKVTSRKKGCPNLIPLSLV